MSNPAMLQTYPPESYVFHGGNELTFSEDIDLACESLEAACKGFGTDEDKLNEVLGAKTAQERYLISLRYKQLHEDKSLRDLLDSETSGDYGKLVELLAVPVEEAEASILYAATKGAGTTESLLYPIICGRSNEDIDILKKAFYKLYDQDLVVQLDSELSGDLKKFLVNCLQETKEPFDETIHTEEKAEEVADAIYDAGQGKWGTDEKAFFRLICSQPAEFLPLVDRVYAQKHGYTLEKVCKKEFGGKVEDAVVHSVNMILKPYNTIASLFESTMKGIGTDEYGLAVCFARYHAVLPKVKQVYEKKYDRSLRDRVHGEVSGKLRDLMMEMLKSC